MERNNRRNHQLKTQDMNMYYIIGGVVLLFIIVFSATYLIYGNSKNNKSAVIDSQKISGSPNNIIIEEASTKIGKTVEESSNSTNNTTEKIAINTSNMNETNTTKDNAKNNNSIKTNVESDTNSNSKKETKEITFIKPVDGDIIKEFAKDNLIFSKTLNEWTTHNGIDLRAEKTEVVKAAAAGTVKTIKNDPRYGLTITIEHEDGYKTVYANLLTSEFVVEGEKVEQGQTIGTVGNTAVFESADDTHLHFEILKDNMNIDPTTVLK